MQLAHQFREQTEQLVALLASRELKIARESEAAWLLAALTSSGFYDSVLEPAA